MDFWVDLYVLHLSPSKVQLELSVDQQLVPMKEQGEAGDQDVAALLRKDEVAGRDACHGEACDDCDDDRGQSFRCFYAVYCPILAHMLHQPG